MNPSPSLRALVLPSLFLAVSPAWAQTPPSGEAAAPPANPAQPATQEVPPPVSPPNPSGTAMETEGPTTPPTETPPGPNPAENGTPEPDTAPAQEPPPDEVGPTPGAAPAPADEKPVVASPPPEPELRKYERPGAHNHDGVFVRIGTGFTAWGERLASEDSEVYDGEVDGESSGIATVTEIALGGTVAPGWVVGGNLVTTDLLASNFRLADDSSTVPPAEVDPGLRQLVMLGAFFDWYPDPREGFHVGAGLSVGALTPRNASGTNRDDGNRYVAGGLGLSFEIGHQWWIGREWSAGVRGRAALAGFVGEDDEDVRWLHGIWTTPGVLFDIVYH